MKKILDVLPGLAVGFYFLVLVLLYKRLSVTGLIASLGLGAIVYATTENLLYGAAAAIVGLFVMSTFAPTGKEGFNTRTPAPEIADLLRKTKQANTAPAAKPAFATENIVSNGWDRPGFGLGGPLVEGFEDKAPEKSAPAPKETNEQPAPVKKESLAVPFKLGEIPTQVKDGPHLDASSTLMKAIQSLNPEQIKAMSSDTQQLIETQKSLMGMLSSMKPMMQDGKQLMDTFQQMFGQTA